MIFKKPFFRRNRMIWAAVLAIASLVIGIAGLFKLTAITMTLTFMLGIPLMAVGLILYLSVVIQDLALRKISDGPRLAAGGRRRQHGGAPNLILAHVLQYC